MKFRVRSDDKRRVKINMETINTYACKYIPGTWFHVEFTRKKKTKSTPMRRYFFGVVLPLFSEAYGYEPEEALTLHKHLKCTFFGVKPDKHGVYREKDIPKVFADDSDKTIEKKQAYVEWVKRKAAEEGTYIPDPGES